MAGRSCRRPPRKPSSGSSAHLTSSVTAAPLSICTPLSAAAAARERRGHSRPDLARQPAGALHSTQQVGGLLLTGLGSRAVASGLRGLQQALCSGRPAAPLRSRLQRCWLTAAVCPAAGASGRVSHRRTASLPPTPCPCSGQATSQPREQTAAEIQGSMESCDSMSEWAAAHWCL